MRLLSAASLAAWVRLALCELAAPMNDAGFSMDALFNNALLTPSCRHCAAFWRLYVDHLQVLHGGGDEYHGAAER